MLLEPHALSGLYCPLLATKETSNLSALGRVISVCIFWCMHTQITSNSKPAASKAPQNLRQSLFDCWSNVLRGHYETTKLVTLLHYRAQCNTPYDPHKLLKLQPLTTASPYLSFSPVNTLCLSGFEFFHLILPLIVVER